MKRHLIPMLMITVFNLPAWAATQTVTLSVPGMTCAACPLTVKAALGKVEGVSKIDVSYPDRQAVVTFDDTRTQAAVLIKTIADAGYSSNIKQER